MCWMTRFVMSAMDFTAVDAMPLTSVATFIVYVTTVSTAGQLFTPPLVHRITVAL